MSHKYNNPFANPDHPLDVRDGKTIYARDVPNFVKPIEPRVEPVPPNPARKRSRVNVPSGSVLYKNLDWEQPAYREQGETDKKLLTYDKSLERLQAAGFERHARPTEVFGLLIDGLEGKLTGQNKTIYDDMLTNYGEWLSLAIERKGDILVTYFDPVGLQWNGSTKKYDVRGRLSYAQRKQYDISGKASQQFIDLEKFSPDFVLDIYSRPFAALPEKMKEGSQRAQVYLPPEGNIWPVGRDGFGWFDINDPWQQQGLSRGTQRKKISIGNEGYVLE